MVSKIRSSLKEKGIECHSVYELPNPEETRVLLAFNSQKNPRLSTKKIRRVLNKMGVGKFEVPREFNRLSASFLHLEVVTGTRTEKTPEKAAQ